ncbi:glycosyl hydrolase family 61-domain-containing protein [Microdochium trichocladiopsis]|uniref:lytic cellulose monooxygenase (C4-dehydrogenating) n=1 Tax=Microdochium trichocladiopsis TaxID=1682393 RepID=A0A9P9BSC1_9PEZI|nr:glycosyl hydrolase family 61-domain-containing protein [Microdochium trichocladiopsis]KAH7028180.1 glycosyl hydrolase family 61-domain-containing protein [Microdochium trichocladiopsis]
MTASSSPVGIRRLAPRLPILLLAALIDNSFLALPPVSAHSFVSSISINELAYHGFAPVASGPAATPSSVVGWSTTAYDQGYVNQTGFAPISTSTSPDGEDNDDDLEIICHRGSRATPYHAPVAAGGAIHVQWNGWPEGHKGPVLSYLAFCVRGCNAVRKSELEFFKIEEAGLSDTAVPTNLAEMTWASDQLIANNNSWVVSIPAQLRPGFYVLRHEIIALHNASMDDGAQNYPQCLNLLVTPPPPPKSESGAVAQDNNDQGYILPKGVLGRELYDANGRDRASFDIDIYAPFDGQNGTGSGNAEGSTKKKRYQIPGPAVALWGKEVGLSHPMPTGAGVPVAADS